MERSRRQVLQLLSVATVTALAGCSQSSDGGGGATPTATATATATVTATDTKTATDTETTTTTATGTAAESTPTAKIVAEYPTDGGEYRRETVVGPDDIASVGAPQSGPTGTPYVTVTLTDAAAERYVDVMRSNGFTDEGVGSCRWQDSPDDPGWCLYTVVDGEVTYAAGVSPGLADILGSGEFVADPRFRLQTATMDDARALAAAFGWEG